LQKIYLYKVDQDFLAHPVNPALIGQSSHERHLSRSLPLILPTKNNSQG